MSNKPRRNRADAKGQAAKEREERDIERAWEIDPEWQSYVTHVRTELVPKLEDSAMTVSIVPRKAEDVDIKFAVELGLSIMLDKPLILCVHPSTVIPERLRRVADEIVIGYPAESRDELIAAIDRVGQALGGDDNG